MVNRFKVMCLYLVSIFYTPYGICFLRQMEHRHLRGATGYFIRHHVAFGEYVCNKTGNRFEIGSGDAVANYYKLNFPELSTVDFNKLVLTRPTLKGGWINSRPLIFFSMVVFAQDIFKSKACYGYLKVYRRAKGCIHPLIYPGIWED